MRVLVVGGGLVGVQTAYFLHESGCEVIVLEKQAQLGCGASYANGGMLAPSHSAPWNSPGIVKSLLASLFGVESAFVLRWKTLLQCFGWLNRFVRCADWASFYRSVSSNLALAEYSVHVRGLLKARFDWAVYHHVAGGTLTVYRHAASMNRGKAVAEYLGERGVRFVVCGAEELGAYEKALCESKAFVGGVFFPGDEHGDARRFVCAVGEYLRLEQVQLRMGEEVLALEPGKAGVKVLSSKAVYAVDAVVVAAASESVRLFRLLGLGLPVQPLRGHSVTFDVSRFPGVKPCIPVIDDAYHVFCSPLGEELRVGGLAELSGSDLRVSSRAVARLRGVLRDFYPGLGDELPVLQWVGLRPMTPDGVPILGVTPVDRVFVNTGHGNLGWTTSSASSQMVADIVLGKKTALDQTPYAWSRFA